VEPPPGRGSRILVVDDHPSSAQALAALLREEGHEAAVASCGAEAMSALAEGAYGLLLVDPSLLDHTGRSLLMRAEELGVPKIVMTSDPAFDPKRTHYAKISGFLYKPIRLPTLLGLIANALNPGRPV
jgi:DNA-binding NtrC family response regulator